MKELKDISTRLKSAKKKFSKAYNKKPQPSGSSLLGVAFKMSTELVAAVLIGTFIGFILDSWFDTKPILIIIFFIIGVAAGITNVFRSAKNMQEHKE